jgi:hypothetical protein
MSQRLVHFITETDRCTSKHIRFFDTMPAAHPFRLGEDIHCANYGNDPEVSTICLDLVRAHETTIAHELAHLWLIYVQGGDDCRALRDKSDNGKVNQLDFLQSFVLDLKVNDLIAERGFDMSLINNDEIGGLTELRDAFAIGYKPPTPREALVNSLSIAGAILEQKRWPDKMKHRLSCLLDFFEVTVPQIYRTAQELVAIVKRHGYDSREAVRKVLDECILLGFRATGDDLDLERDLKEPTLNECMQDKHPEQFAGCPVLLKLETGKAMARNGVTGSGMVWLSASATGMAQITIEDAGGVRRGPFAVNYQLIPRHPLFNYSKPEERQQLVGGRVPDTYGRLTGEPGYNTAFPPGHDPFNPFPPMPGAHAAIPDLFGRLPGEPGYTSGHPGHISSNDVPQAGNPCDSNYQLPRTGHYGPMPRNLNDGLTRGIWQG